MYTALFTASTLVAAQACSDEDEGVDDIFATVAHEGAPEAAADERASSSARVDSIGMLQLAASVCQSNADCDSGDVCTTDSCQSGQCVAVAVPPGTSCGNGGVCSSAGQCIIGGCQSNADCSPSQVRAGGRCS